MAEQTALAELENEDDIQLQVSQGGAAALAKSEVEAQIDAAHRYPRSITRFLREALSLATVDKSVAESCIYALPRGGKTIKGPSVRMAEICASAWTNLHIAARIVGVDDTNIIAQGGAWDIEKNVRYSVETRRRITNKEGERFNEDMVTVTGNAAASIALRNAIFRAIPRAYVDRLYEQVRLVAVGDATTLADRRAKILESLQKMGIDQARVLSALGLKGIHDIGLDQLETLIGFRTSITEKTKTIDELFPAPATTPPAPTPETEGRRMPLGRKGKEEKPQPEPPPREPGSDDDKGAELIK